MSGHSKWSTIKHKKNAKDAKRGKIFTRIIKEVQIAVRDGGSDSDSNPRLRLAIQNAKGVNMPKDNILRAISKAEKEGDNLQEYNFEGYGTGGVAIFVECLSDNNQRSVADVRAVFNKRGGSLGTNGSLSFIFDRKGIFTVPKAELDPEEFELEIIDAGVEEFEYDDEHFYITTSLEDFGNMQKKLEEIGVDIENAELKRIPNTTKTLNIEDSKHLLSIIDAFEDLDDVQSVYHNLEMTDELEEALNEM
jgi:YebC/PmpR family DNA-binding regulatory protein